MYEVRIQFHDAELWVNINSDSVINADYIATRIAEELDGVVWTQPYKVLGIEFG